MDAATVAPTPASRWTPQQLGLVFAVWTAIGLFMFSQSLVQRFLSHDPTPWWHSLVSWMVGVWISASLTPVVVWLGNRYPLVHPRWPLQALRHLLLGAVYSVGQIAIESAILPRLHLFPQVMRGFSSTFGLLLVIGLHQAIIGYWAILSLQAGWDFYQRFLEREREAMRLELQARALQSQLANAQLGALKMQLQPHFLFNTLNAIMVLVRQQKSHAAETMLGRLGDLLRLVLDEMHTQEVSLRRELDYLRLYLSIEEVRFQDRLRVDIVTDPEALDAAIPHMCLQPIVENAIRHGIGGSTAAGRIAIRASRVADRLVVTVEDDGPGLARDADAKPTGIGLANTRARLDRLYGAAARLTIANREPTGVIVTVELPFHRAPDTAPEGGRIAYATQSAGR